MNPRSFLVLAVALAANAHADPILHTTAFDENIVIATDTFETAGGAVIFSTGAVGFSDWLSPNIASDLAGDPAVPIQFNQLYLSCRSSVSINSWPSRGRVILRPMALGRRCLILPSTTFLLMLTPPWLPPADQAMR